MTNSRETPPMPALPNDERGAVPGDVSIFNENRDEENGDGISMLSNSNESGVVNLNTDGGGSVVTTLTTRQLLDKESKMTRSQINSYLIGLYQTLQPEKYNSETLSTISSLVRNNVVRKVKFIDHEHVSGLSREAIEDSRKYPSFWKPDLTIQNSIQNDIMNEFPMLKKATLQKKVEAWMGMREKVREAIRGHRNQVNTAIQCSIVAGKYCYDDFKKYFP